MKTLLKMGARNVRRNTRRTLITITAILFGVAVIILTRGMINGIQANIKSTITEVHLGDLQVHAEGYVASIEAASLALSLPQDYLSPELVRSAGVEAAAPRILFGGMAGNGETTAMIVATAIDPAIEYQVTPKKIDAIKAGRLLGPDDIDGIVLAEGLAAALKAELGGTVTVLTNTATGAMNAADFTVVGVLKSANPFENKRVGYVNLATAQRLLSMEGKVTEFALGMPAAANDEDTAAAKEVLLSRLKTKDTAVEVHTWEQLMPSIKDVITMQDGILGAVIGVLFFIVLVGIVNTLLMSVFERIREVGTLLAMGMRRKQIVSLFLIEGLTLGVIGAVVGALLGLLLVYGVDRAGFEMSPPGASMVMHLRVTVDALYPLKAMLIAIVSALVAAAYPALHASRLKPIDAIRSN